ncbi:MAG: hypothetical protein M0R22_10150 [Dehalococcoidia bacterium]|nr:hypothetical protein [Dehalococcoidia bacterium]
MTNRRKIIAGILVATMAVTGLLVGTVSADDEDSGTPRDTLMARVAELLGVDQGDLETAFTQAREEQREQRQEEMQAARDARMQELIDQGVLTQEQVDDWNEWLESRPDNSEAMQEWLESRPDMGDALPFAEGRGGRFGGAMMRGGGMAGFGGFGGLGCPTESEA